jgi:hypothetical protein
MKFRVDAFYLGSHRLGRDSPDASDIRHGLALQHQLTNPRFGVGEPALLKRRAPLPVPFELTL